MHVDVQVPGRKVGRKRTSILRSQQFHLDTSKHVLCCDTLAVYIMYKTYICLSCLRVPADKFIVLTDSERLIKK